eukprot:TRINITY_DN2392_c0_g1_i1.p1 TRINITY_DN2392_c0_g1~~TRINITY_DN2392_c0_g1_i1.p1  ORF type:complete len:647 (+),score=101.54 TRINITY_DN2392_c0_g1_i1:53-1993(+)
MKLADFQSAPVQNQLSLVSSGLRKDGDLEYLKWFCSLHDPRKFSPLDERYETVLGAVREQLPSIIEVLHQVGSDNALEFVLMLRIIGRIDTEEEAVCDPDIFIALNRLIEQGMDNEELLVNSCVVLGLFSAWVDFGEEMRSIIHSSGVVLRLLEIMKRHSNNPKLLVHTTRALNNICFENSLSKLQFIDNGGLNFLVYLLKDAQFPPNVKLVASLLLRNILHLGDFRQKLIPRIKNSLSDLLYLMDLHISDPVIELHLVWSILNVSINLNDIKKDLGKCGGCGAIVRVMARHKDVSIQHACLAAILQLSTKTCNQVTFCKEDVIQEIVSNFCQNFSYPTLIKMSLEAIERLCNQGVGRKRLISEKTFENFIEFVLLNKCDPKLLVLSLGVLYKLSSGANSTREAMKKSVVPVLSEAISSNDVKIRQLAQGCNDCLKAQGGWDSEDSESVSCSDSSDYDSSAEDIFSASGSDSEDMFFDGIKSDVDSLRREGKELDAEIEVWRSTIEDEKEKGRKLKVTLQSLKKQIDKRKKHDELSIDLMNENKALKMTLTETQQSILKLQIKKQEQAQEIELLLFEKTHKRQTQKTIDIQAYSREERSRLIKQQSQELKRFRELQNSLDEANAILHSIHTQLPDLKTTLENFEKG